MQIHSRVANAKDCFNFEVWGLHVKFIHDKSSKKYFKHYYSIHIVGLQSLSRNSGLKVICIPSLHSPSLFSFGIVRKL